MKLLGRDGPIKVAIVGPRGAEQLIKRGVVKRLGHA